ncbi:unnamed protein product [Dibothriocephalus latus]|uniref:W2 domain-containing protein n=1 Tax=Dibothriocephalus latus TaxID=60516 RepID=A0A3P7QTQ9_DIBLA|nr:unnamed protein product [Dibothriocephalus latus]
MRGSGVGVCIGPNVTLPSECVLVPPGPNEVILPPEVCGSKGWATYYQPSHNKLPISSDGEDLSSSSDDESFDETEVVLWRTGWRSPLLDLAANQVKAKETTEPREQIKEFALSFKHVLGQFREVLEKYLTSSGTGSQFCLQAIEDHACYNQIVLDASQWLIHALYDADLVSEETIQWWVKESPMLADEDLTEKTAALRENIAPFLKWLEEAEEEDEDDED